MAKEGATRVPTTTANRPCSPGLRYLRALTRPLAVPGTIDSRRRLLVGKLVLVLQRFLQAIKFLLQLSHHLLLGRVAVQVVQFVGILSQVIKFPLVLLPEVNQFVSPGADAIVSAC